MLYQLHFMMEVYLPPPKQPWLVYFLLGMIHICIVSFIFSFHFPCLGRSTSRKFTIWKAMLMLALLPNNTARLGNDIAVRDDVVTTMAELSLSPPKITLWYSNHLTTAPRSTLCLLSYMWEMTHYFGNRYNCFVNIDTIDGISFFRFFPWSVVLDTKSRATLRLTLVSRAMISCPALLSRKTWQTAWMNHDPLTPLRQE